MTDEEIEKAIELCESENLPCQECAYWKISIQGYNCRNALIRDMHDYINRLKAKNKELQDKNRRVLDWKRRQEKFTNEMIDRFDEELKKQKAQVRKDTAKEIFQTILDDYRGVDYYSFLFEGLQAIADDEYGIRIMPSENGVSVEVDDE